MRQLLAVALVAVCTASFGFDRYVDVLETKVNTKLGVLSIGRGKLTDRDGLYLDGKKIFNGDDSADFRTLSGPLAIGEREVVLGSLNSGGIACPSEFVVVELRSTPSVSTPFGTCSNRVQTRVIGDSLEIRMPTPTPHPDLISKRELKHRESMETVYRWSNGVVVEKK